MSLSLPNTKGLGTALKTLTAIPWPWKESEDLSASLPWFPVIGLLLGLILYGTSLVWGLLPFKQWSAGAALVMIGLGIWLTRGLHYDGLADWADSIGGFSQKEKRLAIMKDVSLGSFGVLALILGLSAKWIAFERILSSGSMVWILVIFILSRNMMVELIVTLPYARSEKGMGRPFVKGSSPEHRLISHVISIIFCLSFGPLALGLFAAVWLQTWLFGLRIKSRFGGITGDLLGTANEMVEVTLLMICALPGERILCYTGWTWIF